MAPMSPPRMHSPSVDAKDHEQQTEQAAARIKAKENKGRREKENLAEQQQG
jgi:hypothetical protein